MKNFAFTLLKSAFVAVAALVALGIARAQIIAYDDAANYYKTANWTNGANLGFGFTPWVMVTNNPGPGNQFHGWLIGNGYTIGQATNVSGTNYTNCAFNIYAN